MSVLGRRGGEERGERTDRKTGNKPEIIRVSDGMLQKLGKTGGQDFKKSQNTEMMAISRP